MKRVSLCAMLLIGIGAVALAQQPSGPPAVPPPEQGGPGPVVKPEILYTPDSSVKYALQDALSLPPEIQPFVRYLSLYNIPKDKRRDFAKIVSFLVNSLGTNRQMFIPVFVGGSDETVIRLNIADYNWDPNSWERLVQNGSGVRPFPEPYFHAFVQNICPAGTKKMTTKTVDVQVPCTTKVPVSKTVKQPCTKTVREFTGYYDQYKKPIYKEKEVTEYVEKEVTEWVEQSTTKTVKKQVQVEETTTTDTTTRQQVNAPWLDPVSIATLSQLTGSVGPVIRADWFIYTASQPPAYFDFLQLGNNIQDFQNLVFANQALAQQAHSLMKAVVVSSNVARNNRTLLRTPTFTGGYCWTTHDALKSIDDRQFMNNFLNEKFDASEVIASLPNGLQVYFVTDGAGNRLDFANPDVALDFDATDKIVRTGRSCMTCHGEGIKPIPDEIRALTRKLQNYEEVKLLVTQEADARTVLDFFAGDIDEYIVADSNYYNKAVALCNGLNGPQNAKLFLECYNYYIEQLLTKEMAARDLGIRPEEMEKYLRLSTDPVVLALVKNPWRPLRRDQWEVSFQGIQLVIIGAQQNSVPIQPFPSPQPVFMPPARLMPMRPDFGTQPKVPTKP